MRPVRRSTVAVDDRAGRVDDLFRREYRAMFGLAFGMVGDNQRAEEIVQDGFLDVLRNFDEIRQPRGSGSAPTSLGNRSSFPSP